ncbi:MAG: carbohydrate ABC transporter substrate-binding protein [Actinobacteria bacterium]|jgi:raffinose/stachyose/melibiose transport system substrate-binding protein|nr:carbohydrate ABC transporter substrate-binding protein [Actinomycetota bacterium]NDE53803.1 carbohydrate ABC transporter substrate-binding protein [Actinomycetota bacterium]
MNKTKKLGFLALASAVTMSMVVAVPAPAATACPKKATVTMLGTIKIEIQDQFLAAVADYNKSQKCYTVKSIPGDRKLTFLQNVTPMYAAKNAPTIMYTLQEIPDMADKVIDWKGTKLVSLVSPGLLAAANVGGKQVGVPSTAEAFGLLYNKKVLADAGIDPAKIKTRGDLENAFKTLQAKGKKAIHFSAIWWSLGAHFTNIYHANSAKTHEGRLKVLDQLSDGSKDLSKDAVFQNWLATFDLLKKYNGSTANLTDTEYDASIASLSSGNYGFLFQGNWTEPNLMTAAPGTDFGIMPLPISTDAATYGNDSIPVGVPGYFMIDAKQSTKAERDGAIDFLTWLYTSPKGQGFVANPVTKGGMGFIPVYKGFKVEPATSMARDISKFVVAGKTLEWINTYYPAGLQETVGKVSMQQYFTDKITSADLAKAIQDAWKGSVKTWRGVKK